MYLGIDIGTSAVKAVLMDDDGAVAFHTTQALNISRPHALWSEQAPDDWWSATNAAVLALPGQLRTQVRAIGLAGQMHGAVLLDRADRPLRPAILWNDGRSHAECQILEQRCLSARDITGNTAMPGFTAPKILWIQTHEPDVAAAIFKVVLPKDYVRLRMTGDYATDMSDASGTLWLDVARRCWSSEMLAASGLSETQMPTLFEGCQPTARLRGKVAAAWGMSSVPVIAGGGDNAAGAVGCGTVNDGETLLSLGTSGVIFVASSTFAPPPAHNTHSFCHAVPGRWHHMAVILSAASALSWIADVVGARDVTSALAIAGAGGEPFCGREIFLPYLSGERTPHNDPRATGVFVGLTHDTHSGGMVRAVMEGIACAFADGLKIIESTGQDIKELIVIGGGARSALWGRILATTLNKRLAYARDAHVGPAHGAARLARLGLTGEAVSDVAKPIPIDHYVEPEGRYLDAAQEKLGRYRRLYPTLKQEFQ